MHDGIDCRRLRARFEAYLIMHPKEDEARMIRAHLAACPKCRAGLGRFFLLERWEEGGIAPPTAGPALARAIMARLEEREAAPPSLGKAEGPGAPGRFGRGILWNYLAAALATLFLAFGGCFDAVTGLAVRTGRLREGIRAIDRSAQRIIEMGIEGPDALRRRIEFHLNERR